MFIALDAPPQQRKGQGKTKGPVIAANVSKEGKLTFTFDEAREHGRLLESTVPSLIVRSAFIPGTYVSLSITHGKTSLLAIRGTYKSACW